MSDPAASLVLIADDDRMAVRILQQLLSREGHQLVFAASGDEALELARKTMPDLVLLDVHMPGLDGYEVCRRLRADAALAEVPVIMVTALTDRDARLRGLDAGADDFISKPFDAMELAARVRTITRLDRYRRVQDARRLTEQIEMAADVQRLLLPRAIPQAPGLEAVGRYRPAARVGGDYYDVIWNDARLAFVVADVTGHGLASALFMSSVRSAFRSLVGRTDTLVTLATAINERMIEDAGDSGVFLSAVFGDYDPATGILALVNCGHPEPLVRGQDGEAISVPASAPPLGMVEGLDAEAHRQMLASGDLVCLYTDGLIEATDASARMFGAPRLREVIGRPHLTLDAAADAIVGAVSAFHGDAALDDDIALLLLRKSA